MEETLIFLQKLLNLTTGISLTVVPLDKHSLVAFLKNATAYTFDPAVTDADSLLQQIITGKSIIFEYKLSDNIFIWVIPLRTQNRLLILGPVTTVSLDNSAIPFAEYNTVCKIGQLLSQFAFGQVLPPVLSADASLIRHAPIAGEDISQMRQVEQRYEYSAALTNAVQQGNLSLAMHLIGQYDPATNTSVRNANPLRNAQNYCIVLNTQLRHALEESGIHPYQVDRLSNEIGLEIEQLKSISQLPDFFSGVIRRYCRLVQEHAYPNLKPLTNLAVTYIKEHLADNLTVKDTAKTLTINANYLSSLFHKDMGMTFIDFVNKERTNQAAALLRHTNLQIQQIASTVGYNNTSYFAKQFVRFQGISPSHYRRET